jgi:hypothetical protein
MRRHIKAHCWNYQTTRESPSQIQLDDSGTKIPQLILLLNVYACDGLQSLVSSTLGANLLSIDNPCGLFQHTNLHSCSCSVSVPRVVSVGVLVESESYAQQSTQDSPTSAALRNIWAISESEADATALLRSAASNHTSQSARKICFVLPLPSCTSASATQSGKQAFDEDLEGEVAGKNSPMDVAKSSMHT